MLWTSFIRQKSNRYYGDENMQYDSFHGIFRCSDSFSSGDDGVDYWTSGINNTLPGKISKP